MSLPAICHSASGRRALAACRRPTCDDRLWFELASVAFNLRGRGRPERPSPRVTADADRPTGAASEGLRLGSQEGRIDPIAGLVAVHQRREYRRRPYFETAVSLASAWHAPLSYLRRQVVVEPTSIALTLADADGQACSRSYPIRPLAVRALGGMLTALTCNENHETFQLIASGGWGPRSRSTWMQTDGVAPWMRPDGHVPGLHWLRRRVPPLRARCAAVSRHDRAS